MDALWCFRRFLHRVHLKWATGIDTLYIWDIFMKSSLRNMTKDVDLTWRQKPPNGLERSPLGCISYYNWSSSHFCLFCSLYVSHAFQKLMVHGSPTCRDFHCNPGLIVTILDGPLRASPQGIQPCHSNSLKLQRSI